MQTIDVHNLTHAQTREPPARVSFYLRVDQKTSVNNLSESDKKEIINFSLTKIFCVSQKANDKHTLHREYLNIVEMLAETVIDRNLLIVAIESLYKNKSYFAEQPFENLVKVVSLIYDSYLPKSEATWYSDAVFDFTDFERLRQLTRKYYKKDT